MPRAVPAVHRSLEGLLVGLFALVLCLPAGVHAVQGGDGEGTRMEYRVPAPLPRLAWDPAFPRAFEKYFDDNFALRTPLVRWHNRIKLMWLGASPSPTFVVGEHGWLYYTGERVMENHTGALRLSDEELEQWRRVLEARTELCRELGCVYLLVVVPDKAAVYPEHLPAAYRHPERRTTTDQLRDHMAARSSVQPLFLHETLRRARGLEELGLYYRLGTHWNDLGAWHGYEAILERLAPLVPRLRALERPRFAIDPEGQDDNFGKRLLLREEMPQEIVVMDPARPLCGRLVAEASEPVAVRVLACDERGRVPGLVFFHDSMGDWLEPYLADTFSRVVSVSKGAFDRDLIRREKPGVVIEEMGERRLWRVPRR